MCQEPSRAEVVLLRWRRMLMKLIPRHQLAPSVCYISSPTPVSDRKAQEQRYNFSPTLVSDRKAREQRNFSPTLVSGRQAREQCNKCQCEKQKEAVYNPWNDFQHRMKGRGYSKDEVRKMYYEWKERQGIQTKRNDKKASENASAGSCEAWRSPSWQRRSPNWKSRPWTRVTEKSEWTAEAEDFEMIVLEEFGTGWELPGSQPPLSSTTWMEGHAATPSASAGARLSRGAGEENVESGMPVPKGPPRTRRPLK